MRTACRHYIPMYLLAFMVLTVSAAHDFSDESISSSSAKELGKVGRSNQMMRREHTVIDALGSVSLHSFAEADSETRTGSNIFSSDVSNIPTVDVCAQLCGRVKPPGSWCSSCGLQNCETCFLSDRPGANGGLVQVPCMRGWKKGAMKCRGGGEALGNECKMTESGLQTYCANLPPTPPPTPAPTPPPGVAPSPCANLCGKLRAPNEWCQSCGEANCHQCYQSGWKDGRGNVQLMPCSWGIIKNYQYAWCYSATNIAERCQKTPESLQAYCANLAN